VTRGLRTAAPAANSDTRDTQRPGKPVAPRVALGALCALTGINLLNYLDRYIPSAIASDLTAPPLSLSDHQLGWLMSSFLLVYMLAAPVFGALGDRGSRTRPIAVGIFVWSLATVLSGLAHSYPQLLFGRAAVGVGEAAFVAIAPALLADYFAAGSRGRVLSVLNMAIYVGSALGYVVGGLMSHHFGWRAAFYVAGAPGVLLAALVLRLPDPIGSRAPRAQSRTAVSVYVRLLKERQYVLVVLGYAAYTFAVGGLAFWMPSFLQRIRGIPQVQATSGFGVIVVITGFVGALLGGWLGDYWLKYSRQAYLWMSALVTLLAAPCALLALSAAAPEVYYPALVAAQLLLFMSAGPVNAAIIGTVHASERASAFALSTFAIHLLGDVPSPVIIGHLSEASSLGRAVLIVPAVIVVSGLVWLLGARLAPVSSETP
jgi:MFS transporter, Spinster family, sphingosine-1-phosphate transporter